MRVAIQIFGELRNWEEAHSLFSIIKRKFKQSDVEIDIHMHVWDSEYTRECKEKGLFDICTTFSYDKMQEEGVVRNGHYEHTRNRSRGLYNWSLSMYKASLSRRKYQYERGVDYKYIILTRPDVYIREEGLKFLLESLRLDKEQIDTRHTRAYSNRFFTIFTNHLQKALGRDYKWPCYDGNDNTLYGTQEAINLYTTNFHLLYIKKDDSVLPYYHANPGLIAMKYNLDTVVDEFRSLNINYLRDAYKVEDWYKE